MPIWQFFLIIEIFALPSKNSDELDGYYQGKRTITM
jgi:hypothetical protein